MFAYLGVATVLLLVLVPVRGTAELELPPPSRFMDFGGFLVEESIVLTPFDGVYCRLVGV